MTDASFSEPTVAGEGWFNNRWRPAMAWQYFTVCLCDFIVFPASTQIMNGSDHAHPWQSLTLQGGGFYHIAMGGIVGMATYMRSQEKLAVFNGPLGPGTMSSSTTTVSSSSKQTDPQQTSSRADPPMTGPGPLTIG